MTDRASRQLSYAWQRFVLRRRILLADGLPLGMQFRFRAPDDVGRRIFKRGVHEPHILELLRTSLDPSGDAIAIDAGANLGWYPVLLHMLHAGQLETLACEPDPDNFALLRNNIALNGASSVHAVDCALSDRDGRAALHRYRDINLGRHNLDGLPWAVDQVEVPVRRLDNVLAERGLDGRTIAFMKVDVEGHEPALLRGAAQALERTRLLVLEYSPMYYAEDDAASMLDQLTHCGLSPRLWAEGAWRPCAATELLARHGQCDTAWSRA